MIYLSFTGKPNVSLEIGDWIYYVDNLIETQNTNGVYTTDDKGVSSPSLIGRVHEILVDKKLVQTAGESEGEVIETIVSNTDESNPTFVVRSSTIGALEDVTAPPVASFIFFSKNNLVETSSIAGYYNEVEFQNNSRIKAELFSTTFDVDLSSK